MDVLRRRKGAPCRARHEQDADVPPRISGASRGSVPATRRLAGDEVVDLVDRRGGALNDAHVEDLLQGLGGGVGAHEGGTGAAVVLGEGERVPADGQVGVLGELLVEREAVVEGEVVGLVGSRPPSSRSTSRPRGLSCSSSSDRPEPARDRRKWLGGSGVPRSARADAGRRKPPRSASAGWRSPRRS